MIYQYHMIIFSPHLTLIGEEVISKYKACVLIVHFSLFVFNCCA